MSKLLLVEDNEMNSDMLSRRLVRRGYEVVLAVDGAEGINMAQFENPDLVLMDMNLPVLDGWEASRRLKAARRLAPFPFWPSPPTPCRRTGTRPWRRAVTITTPSPLSSLACWGRSSSSWARMANCDQPRI